MRNNVPGGENVGEFPPSGVERAGGARGEGLIERLRRRIRALEQVPVSLAFPPAPGAGLPRPACSLLLSPCIVSSYPSPLPGKEAPPLSKLAAGGLHEIRAAAYRDQPAALAFALAFLGERLAQARQCLARTVVPDGESRARMGRPLRSGPARLRSRPSPFSHRRDAQYAGRGLGPGRRTEERGLRRRPGTGRGQGAARRQASWACRPNEPHPLSSPLRASGRRSARDAYPLAHRGGGKQPRLLRCFRSRRALLASHA